jgi:FixJ family two-component response regulator
VEPLDDLALAELLDAVRQCLSAAGTANSLTDIERHIVQQVVQGATDRSLAAALGLAPSTVNARKQSAYAKLRRCLAAKGHRQMTRERNEPPRE